MNNGFFLQGLIMGFSIAAPVGPIGILCIRRTLAKGPIAGLVSGLGAATADGIYGCIAAFGLSFVASFLLNYQFWLRLIGGGFLCYLGLRIFLASPVNNPAQAKEGNLIGAYASTLFLTLTNPLTIFSFYAIFLGLGFVSNQGSYLLAVILVLGVFLGSALWWLLLSAFVGFFRARFTPKNLQWVNRVAGLIIIGFGFWALIKCFQLVLL